MSDEYTDCDSTYAFMLLKETKEKSAESCCWLTWLIKSDSDIAPNAQ